LVVAALAPLTTNDVEEIRKISSLSRHSGRIVRKKVSELINPLVAQGQLEEAVDIILKIGNIESVHWEPIWQATGKLESSLSSCQRIQKLKSKIGDRYSAEELLRELNKQLAGKILEIINDDKLSNAELADIYELTPERLRRQVEAKIIERWEKYLDDTAFLRKIWVIDPEFGKVLVNFKTGAMMTKVLASLPPKE
jgi:polyhydroxyalkanoate synthesis regulator phasin